jgi:hypothetical protein
MGIRAGDAYFQLARLAYRGISALSVMDMIVFDLSCSAGHGFEGWFKDAQAFKSQRKVRKISCPVCADTDIARVPAGSRISHGHAAAVDRAAQASAEARAWRETAQALHAKVAENCENVGPRFAEEARKIHYGEADSRGIYGEATVTEARELVDEGVPVLPLPRLPESDA